MGSQQSSVSAPSGAFKSTKTGYLKAANGNVDLVVMGSGKMPLLLPESMST